MNLVLDILDWVLAVVILVIFVFFTASALYPWWNKTKQVRLLGWPTLVAWLASWAILFYFVDVIVDGFKEFVGFMLGVVLILGIERMYRRADTAHLNYLLKNAPKREPDDDE